MKNLKALACLGVPLFVLVVCAARAQTIPIPRYISDTFIIDDNAELVEDVTCEVPPNKPCIEFGASGITLKLKGFTITGPAHPPTDCPNFTPGDGIAVVGKDDVAILGPGLVQRFARHGIFLSNAKRAKVKRVTASDNCFSGMLLGGVTDSVIEKNVSVRNAIGSAIASQNFPCGGT